MTHYFVSVGKGKGPETLAYCLREVVLVPGCFGAPHPVFKKFDGVEKMLNLIFALIF
jgi:hypothetical protein